MSAANQIHTSKSLAIYGALLGLYPTEYLREHKAELLQNFQDLEHTFSSKPELWLFMGRDLVVSLRPQILRTFWGQTGIVIIVLSTLWAYAAHHGVSRERAIEGFCCGYILGWFVGWLGKQWQVAPISHVPTIMRSLPMQATMIASMLLLVLITGGNAESHLILAGCYGFLLAWFAGWIGNGRRRHVRADGEPPTSTR